MKEYGFAFKTLCCVAVIYLSQEMFLNVLLKKFVINNPVFCSPLSQRGIVVNQVNWMLLARIQ